MNKYFAKQYIVHVVYIISGLLGGTYKKNGVAIKAAHDRYLFAMCQFR